MQQRVLVLSRCSAAGLLVAAATAPLSAQTTISTSQYRDLVATYTRASASKDQVAVDMARQRLATVRQVQRADGSTVTLDNTLFASSVAATDAAARARLVDYLLTPPASGPNRPDPQQAVRKILSDPEFKSVAKASEEESGFDKVMRDIAEKIRDFLRWVFGNNSGVPKGDAGGLGVFLSVLVRFLLFISAAVAVVWAGIYVARWVSFRQVKKVRDTMATGLDLDDAVTDPLGKAREMAQQGEMRQALRYAYIASLRRLAGSGLLVLQESRTNWEYQSALRARSQEAYDTLLPATRLFDLVWYGRREATADEFAEVLAIHDALPEAQVTEAQRTGTSPSPKKGDGNAW